MHPRPMSATTKFVSGNVASPPFETLLARLATESQGLTPSAMFETFCRFAGQSFQVSGVCCCIFSSRDQWTVAATYGINAWGDRGEPLSPSVVNWAERARRDGRTVLCRVAGTEGSRNPESGSAEVVVPFLNRDELLGVAILSWTGTVERPAEILLQRLTLLGTFFAALLDHARLFEQVFRSREKWLRVIDAIPDAIVVHDDQGNIVRINRPLAERMGVHPSELIGRPICHVLPAAADRPAGACPFCRDNEE